MIRDMVVEEVGTQFNALYSGNLLHPGCQTIAWVSASAQSQSFQHLLALSLLMHYKKARGKRLRIKCILCTEPRKSEKHESRLTENKRDPDEMSGKAFYYKSDKGLQLSSWEASFSWGFQKQITLKESVKNEPHNCDHALM